MKAMKAELKASGMSEEEILQKTCILMKAFNRTDPMLSMAEYNLASKQKNLALKNNSTSPKDFTLVSIVSQFFKMSREKIPNYGTCMMEHGCMAFIIRLIHYGRN